MKIDLSDSAKDYQCCVDTNTVCKREHCMAFIVEDQLIKTGGTRSAPLYRKIQTGYGYCGLVKVRPLMKEGR